VRSVVAGTGSYLPARVVENRDLEAFLDTTDTWIRERTGIGARRIAADDEVTSDLAAHAARRALEVAGRDPSEVDLLIVATVTPDSPMPACAVRVQQKLGITSRAPAFDVSAACAGFLFGLTIADQFLRTGSARVVVVVGVELLSRIIDWTDRTTAVLFGDGAGAVVLERGEDDARGIEAVRIHTDGALADALSIPAGGSAEPVTVEGLAAGRNKVHMVGQDVFRAAVRGLGDVADEVLTAAGVSAVDVDAFVFHQANIRILEAVAERLGVPMEKLVLVLECTGNTSSASIPIALDEALRTGRLARGQRVLLAALGAGVSWGGALLRL
jgi:3-oxoacyl-[acyl-carrier-protein] synthase-3